MCTANASPSIPATARSRPASPCIASAAIPMGCRWCGSRPSADLWCSLRTLRTITPICINAARFRSSTISATWPQDGRSSSGSPVIPIVSSPGTTRSLRRSTPAPATRSTPLPCTKCHRAHSRNSRRAALRSIARPQGRSASASRTRCSPRPRSSTELDPQQSRRARLAILRGKPDRCVRRAEARIIFALNDLEEESVVEHPRIGLKKFAAVVAIVEDVVVTQGFGHAGREVVFGFEIVEIVVRDVQEHRTLLAYARNCREDIVRGECDVLDARAELLGDEPRRRGAGGGRPVQHHAHAVVFIDEGLALHEAHGICDFLLRQALEIEHAAIEQRT